MTGHDRHMASAAVLSVGVGAFHDGEFVEVVHGVEHGLFALFVGFGEFVGLFGVHDRTGLRPCEARRPEPAFDLVEADWFAVAGEDDAQAFHDKSFCSARRPASVMA